MNLRPYRTQLARLPAMTSGLGFALAVLATMAGEAPLIRFNTLGYLPAMPKQATIAAPSRAFAVVRLSDGAEVFAGVAAGPRLNADTQEQVWVADFSAVEAPGRYRLTVEGIGQSTPFLIDPTLYRGPFRTVTRGMYLWRCGTAVRGEHGGDIFAHAACHTNDARLDFVGREGQVKDGTGGWHDAGDYNKYVVNSGVTVGAMFRAWEDFGPAIRRVSLDLPEADGPYPEFLAELKWQTDWLLKMQAPDGSVYHKLSTTNFGPMILPDQETADRYFTPWSSAATADFTAMLAQAARHFQAYDAAYAERCLEAARKSYAFLQANPANTRADLSGFRTGAYQTRDDDDRLWAAAELWETTGDRLTLRDLETRIRAADARVDQDFDWGSVGNLGLFTYLTSERSGRDLVLVARLRDNLLAAAEDIVRTRNAHGYARPLGTRYYWGCNGSVARQVLLLQAAHRLDPKPEFRNTALDALNHLFGRNPYGRSFVTGLGFRPPRHPHDRRSAGDTVDQPWPGYLVGGAHPTATDWKDEEADYRTNEIAINWNGALIYALAAFLEPEPDTAASDADLPSEPKRPDVVYVPTPQRLVDYMLELAEVKPGDVLYDLGCGDGRIVVTAAQRYGVRAEGFDIDPLRIQESLENVRSNRVEHLVSIRQEDIFDLDLREATVVTLYLLPSLNVRLMPQLAQLRPGSRIVSHAFDMEGAKPVQVERVTFGDNDDPEYDYGPVTHTVYKWIVPWETQERAYDP
jgi:endoglucanase